MSRLEEILSRTTINVPGKTIMAESDFKWLIRRVEKLECTLRKYAIYPNDILYFDPDIKTDPKEIIKIIKIPIAQHAREALAEDEGDCEDIE